MNLKKNKVKWYIQLFCTASVLLMFLFSCSKTEEPPKPIGQQIPYTGNGTKSLAALLDSIPQATIFKAVFQRSATQLYMDSLAMKSNNVAYTMFVPSDEALNKAGYTLDKVNAMSVGDINLLVGYLILPGTLTDNVRSADISATLYPIIRPEYFLKRTTPTVYTKTIPYFYRMNVGFDGNSLLLNGINVKENAIGIAATNGVIYMIDKFTPKPEKEMYEVLNTDTAFSFYMAALRKSNTIYQLKGMIGNASSNTQYNDTTWLMLQRSTITPYIAGTLPCAVAFAPDNSAFRKAGFSSIAAINSYIDQSKLAVDPNAIPMLTNMDSILVNHRFLAAFVRINFASSMFFTKDMHYMNAFTNGINQGAVSITNNQSKITLHRQDFPSGRGAEIIATSDINTLNGVIHRVNNLMLPTP